MKHINDVTERESKALLDWFLDLLYRNHELQVRFKWQNKNDIGTSCCSLGVMPPCEAYA